jgi:cellulose synthase/poly-beta-1,6-N-acetylglucosamine synthase-like glycosyltransferase
MSAARRSPAVDVIVAVHDEAALIDDKLAELAALEHPGALRFFIVDGASRDDTAERVRRFAAGDARFRLIELLVADKTAQLNAALALGTAPWVLVTDADARLPRGLLPALVAAGESDPAVATVGAAVVPCAAHRLEHLYWRASNRLRRAEAWLGCASIVIAGCYAFRRALLARFPDDVLADDVHVALCAAAAGHRVAHVAKPEVCDLRAPRALPELFHHKRRKAHGYLREVLRFLPRVASMRGPAGAVFVWRAALLLAAPPLLALTALALAGALFEAGRGDPPAALAAGALALGAGASARGGRRAVAWLALGGLLAGAQLAALLGHPFARLRSCHPRVVSAVGSTRGARA